ncbi:cytoskeleton-associated protein CAP5.5, putative [Leishmania donovani]|uniref:Cytoskeleton-associated protein CAP5.5, putative n=1 Tax=Leishmania donovani TaxID=5661 RepID=A0A3S7X470_LEIDO|nr:cytoskeleton-associated protein CAP5.5, putative [Leishmania donovani]
MGCCNSKETKKPKEVKVPQAEAQSAKVSSETASVEEQRKIEFRVASAVEDLRAERIEAICAHSRACPYRYNACTVVGGEVKFYFEGGIIFCIVKEGSWYVYNDSLDYEAHVTVRFGQGSNIVAGERAELEEVEDGWTCAHAVVYPLETVHLVSGTANGYRTSITIKPLDGQYRHDACAAANGTAEAETEAVRSLVTEGMDEEAILHRCMETGTPYVDLKFPPNGEAVARAGRDTRTIPEMAMMRPTQYLSDNNRLSVNDICGPVLALSIEPGNLGDSWFMCAVAIMAENEAAVRNIFAQGSPAEKAVGAYRVLVNKNGWWHTLIMDDYLPTFNRMPVFARSYDNPAEMWTSLLQKAYAKLHGSYAAITGGDALQALADLSGSPMCRFDKEWEEATTDAGKAGTLANALVQFSRSGACIVLSTPGHNSESYLGRSQASDAAAFRAHYKKVGLHLGYTYSLERVVMVEECNTLLFKVRNPWRSSNKWTGAWSYGSRQWDENRDACLLCGAQKDPQDGSFWMCWDDATRYFDGGGVLFSNPDATDYRVKGVFCKTIPSAVLEITASESTRVLFTLSQPDKRGVDRKEGAALFAPIMLTVSKAEGGVQRVQKNTSWNPTMPSEEFNFVVGRDVSMWFTLEAEEKYQLVPRMHLKGVRSNYDRPYVISIMSADKLEGNVRVEAKRIDSSSKVFTNYIAYSSEELPSAEVESQVRLPGKAPVTYVSTTVI